MGPHRRCLHGHRLDVAGMTRTYSHVLGLHATCCLLCLELHTDRPAWYDLDHTVLRRADVPPGPHPRVVELVAHPPDRPAGVGHIALQVHGRAVADVDLQLCGIDRRACVEQISVDEDYRRRRVGTVLVAAALALGPGWQWSTTKIDSAVGARAFWASLDTADVLHLGGRAYCSHMEGAHDVA
ncbi:GNAT family N-acetyltransferase [Amycolatopsis sp. PS_44_ISF1]|uniref:GNAT family N-acetyltransferase n=1 Tax=Amycolatopsis sp. PS_44_ISF1 TaxID=2974917 RepID=UPI0028DFFF04|nr:GNAT family N-acetyltransferase [Amycolatopsis sp. PS_44_ISF1]MDT8916218.1 hypothetical protein [Amycolatopsis sp. PS_44_ISF1]